MFCSLCSWLQTNSIPGCSTRCQRWTQATLTNQFSLRALSFLSRFSAKARLRRYVATRTVAAAVDTVVVEAVVEAMVVAVAAEVITTTVVDEAVTTTATTTTMVVATITTTLRVTAPLPTLHLLSSQAPTPGRHPLRTAFRPRPQAGFLLHKQVDGKVQEAMAARPPSRSALGG
jgi:hypothetical protein